MSLGLLSNNNRNGSTQGRQPAKKPSIDLSVPPLVKKSSKCRSFHFRYMELCRAKNLTPVPDIRSKTNATTYLELYGDKLGVNEWLLIMEALYYDQVLQSLTVRMRRSHPDSSIEPIDTERNARLFRQKPVLYTRFIFSGLVEAISNCVESNKNLVVLKLECLPLQANYIESIAKALAANESLKELSFHKSHIGDKGCEAVCSTVRYLNCVEYFDVSECNITSKGAECVAEMIKMQKISRFSEGWEKSLRYRSVDINSIAGLRTIVLSNNPKMGDTAVKFITEVLKEDAWVKIINMENCGLTDIGANLILDCLDMNNTISEFSLRNNEGISKFLQRNIRDHFGKEDEEKQQEPQYDLSGINGLRSLPKSKKYSVSQLLMHTKILEEQLSFERMLRKKAEKLNEKLTHQLMSIENNVAENINAIDSNNMPRGYVIVRDESLQSIIKESQTYRNTHSTKIVNTARTSVDTTPRSELVTLRQEDEDQQHKPERVEESQQFEMESQSDVDISPLAIPDSALEPRKMLQVRKVRSEMKYVEAVTKDNAKKHESKSDHEFANERVFKLSPMVQFEADIGDSLMNHKNMGCKPQNYGCGGDADNGPQRFEHCEQYEGEGTSFGVEQKHNIINYVRKHKTGVVDINAGQRSTAHYESGHFGDGVGVNINNNKRRDINNGKMRSNGDSLSVKSLAQGHIAQYISDLDRQLATNSNKKRQNINQPFDPNIGDCDSKHDSNSSCADFLPPVDIYDMNFEGQKASVDSTLANSDSDAESTLRERASKYSPMQVFMRRKSSDLSDEAGSHENDEDYDDDDNGSDSDQLLSPRSVYMELQRKKTERMY